MLKFWRTKYIKYIFSCIILTVGALFAINTELYTRPLTEKTAIELQQEYSQLTIMPDSSLGQSKTLYKAGAVSVTYDFYTNKSGDEIKKYYLEELRKNQWIIVSDSDHAIYCTKAKFQLTVGFNDSSLAGQYQIYLRWPKSR